MNDILQNTPEQVAVPEKKGKKMSKKQAKALFGKPAEAPVEGSNAPEAAAAPETSQAKDLKTMDKEFYDEVEAYAKEHDPKLLEARHRGKVLELWMRAKRSHLKPEEHGFFQRRSVDLNALDTFAKKMNDKDLERIQQASKEGKRRYKMYGPKTKAGQEELFKKDIIDDLERQIINNIDGMAKSVVFKPERDGVILQVSMLADRKLAGGEVTEAELLELSDATKVVARLIDEVAATKAEIKQVEREFTELPAQREAEKARVKQAKADARQAEKDTELKKRQEFAYEQLAKNVADAGKLSADEVQQLRDAIEVQHSTHALSDEQKATLLKDLDAIVGKDQDDVHAAQAEYRQSDDVDEDRFMQSPEAAPQPIKMNKSETLKFEFPPDRKFAIPGTSEEIYARIAAVDDDIEKSFYNFGGGDSRFGSLKRADQIDVIRSWTAGGISADDLEPLTDNPILFNEWVRTEIFPLEEERHQLYEALGTDFDGDDLITQEDDLGSWSDDVPELPDKALEEIPDANIEELEDENEPEEPKGLWGRITGSAFFRKHFKGELVERTEPMSKSEIATSLAGAALVDVGGSIFGYKVLADVPRYLSQRYYTGQERARLMKEIGEAQKLEQIGYATTTKVGETKFAISEASTRASIERTMAAIEANKTLTAEQKERLFEQVEAIQAKYRKGVLKASNARNKEIAQTIDSWIQTRITGTEVLKQMANTAAIAAGGAAWRPFIYGGASLAARWNRVEMERGRGERTESQMHEFIVNGFIETADSMMGEKGKTKRERFTNAVKAWSTVARGVGMGIAAYHGMESINELLAAYEAKSAVVEHGSAAIGGLHEAASITAYAEHHTSKDDYFDAEATVHAPAATEAASPDLTGLTFEHGEHVAVTDNIKLTDLARVHAWDAQNPENLSQSTASGILARQIDSLGPDAIRAMGYKGDLANKVALHTWELHKAFEIGPKGELSTDSIGKSLLLTENHGTYSYAFVDAHSGVALPHDQMEHLTIHTAEAPDAHEVPDPSPWGPLPPTHLEHPEQAVWGSTDDQGHVVWGTTADVGGSTGEHVAATAQERLAGGIEFAPQYDTQTTALFMSEIDGRQKEIKALQRIYTAVRQEHPGDSGDDRTFIDGMQRLIQEDQLSLNRLIAGVQNPARHLRPQLKWKGTLLPDAAVSLAFRDVESSVTAVPVSKEAWDQLKEQMITEAKG